jgi:hypothetical protein
VVFPSKVGDDDDAALADDQRLGIFQSVQQDAKDLDHGDRKRGVWVAHVKKLNEGAYNKLTFHHGEPGRELLQAHADLMIDMGAATHTITGQDMAAERALLAKEYDELVGALQLPDNQTYTKQDGTKPAKLGDFQKPGAGENDLELDYFKLASTVVYEPHSGRRGKHVTSTGRQVDVKNQGELKPHPTGELEDLVRGGDRIVSQGMGEGTAEQHHTIAERIKNLRRRVADRQLDMVNAEHADGLRPDRGVPVGLKPDGRENYARVATPLGQNRLFTRADTHEAINITRQLRTLAGLDGNANPTAFVPLSDVPPPPGVDEPEVPTFRKSVNPKQARNRDGTMRDVLSFSGEQTYAQAGGFRPVDTRRSIPHTMRKLDEDLATYAANENHPQIGPIMKEKHLPRANEVDPTPAERQRFEDRLRTQHGMRSDESSSIS